MTFIPRLKTLGFSGHGNKLIPAKAIYAVAKDAISILTSDDFPLQDLLAYAQDIVPHHPHEYCINTLKGFAHLMHNRSEASLTQNLAYEIRLNNALNTFLNSWQKMKLDHKKEFVSKLLVNTITKRIVGSDLKLFTDSAGKFLINYANYLKPTLQGSAVLVFDPTAVLPKGSGLNSNFSQLESPSHQALFEQKIAELKPTYESALVGNCKDIEEAISGIVCEEQGILKYLARLNKDREFIDLNAQIFNVKAKQEMVRRAIPAILNLTHEINQLKLQSGSEVRINRLKALLLKLDTSFNALDGTASTQIAFNKVTSGVLRELNWLKRSDMILTKSQENLRALLQSVDLLYTGKTETHNLQALQELQPQSSQIQPDLTKTYEQYLMREAVDNENLWTEADDSLRNEVIKHYIASSQDEALQEIETIILNRDTNCTIAKNIFTVIQDSATIIATDFPLKEIGDYAHETITHPTAYLLNIAKDFAQLGHFLKSFVSDYAKNNIASLGASKKDAYEFSKKYNEAVHKFAEGWKNLSLEHKKEFVAKLIVDLAANKALGIGAKLISNIMGDCIISFVDRLPPSISGGGAIPIPQDLALAHEVAEVVQAVGEVAGSTSVALGTTGISSTVDMMVRRENVTPIHAEGSPDYLEKYVKLTLPVDQPIESIQDRTTIIHKVPLTAENKVIKEFDIIKNHYDHAFSGGHKDKGIMKVGSNETDITEKLTNIVLDLDRQGLIIENGVQIETAINNVDITIRTHIANGKVFSFNVFPGISNNVIGRLIKYLYKGL